MIRKLAGSAALAVAVLAVSPPPASAAPQWEITATPDTSWRTSMNDVVAFPGGDAWAVGSFEQGGEPLDHTSLVWRWDGTRWNDVSPSSTSVYDGLSVVTGSSGDDVWAFGRSGPSYPADSVVWRWDGRTWTRTTLPRDQGNPVVVHDAAMVGGEVWAVGNVTGSFPTASAAALRWNGTSWSRMAVPVPSGSSVLNGMRVAGPNDVWAVGWTKAPTSGSFTQPFVVHWDGTRWSRVSTPALSKDVTLSDVEIRAGEVWAAGSQGWMNQTPRPGPYQPFLMRWNGQSWTQTPAPSSALNLYLSSLGLRDGQLWAVGTSGTVLTWNGQSWLPGPTPPEGSVDFSALTSGPNGTLWAAGNSNGPFLMRLTG